MFRDLRRKDRKMDLADSQLLLHNVDEGFLGTISVDTGHPHVVAVNHYFDGDAIYFHCAKDGHKIDNILNNNKVSFFVCDDVSISQKKFTTNYSSVEVFGRATLVDDQELKKKILFELSKKYVGKFISGFAAELAGALNVTAVVKIEIEHISGKSNIKK
jgi:nitroimidazol reductase NimA-like FMN-containing flavoprotein (pyridoxamine 5'-phosphate oxidase superfamily)